MEQIKTFSDNFKRFFTETLAHNYFSLILELIMFTVLFYYMFRTLKNSKAQKLIYVSVISILVCGLILAISGFSSQLIVVVIGMFALTIFLMFNAEIKRSMMSSGMKKINHSNLTVSGIELIIEETVRAVQNMSKKNIGALIVLSNENLPEGIVESGTVVNAQITSQMIEAVFYPKAPLHDGAMIIEGSKIYAAGCFLPLAHNENLPKEMGSRHRAALGVTAVAKVTVIVVSEETGIISIVKNGEVKKKYADAANIKNALSDYYWSDLTSAGKA